eukprot:2024937-Pyramimonas_sp.AAC.1
MAISRPLYALFVSWGPRALAALSSLNVGIGGAPSFSRTSLDWLPVAPPAARGIVGPRLMLFALRLA